MPTDISAISGSGSLPLARPGQSSTPLDNGFGESLQRVLETVDSTNSEANDAVGRMLNGTGDVHEAMIALQRADVTMQLAVQVRNKIVQAYQDIMRMPV
ncbi:MAG TPA: flagellar hook-basal body complex protein FliE [Vicinamibacterales bacterium]|nr:flagellar hook-basal body complex protein FliE [Vicinamibacterales bacterium]